MMIHVQYVEIGNRRHLEKILALQDTRENMEKERVCINPSTQHTGREVSRQSQGWTL